MSMRRSRRVPTESPVLASKQRFSFANVLNQAHNVPVACGPYEEQSVVEFTVEEAAYVVLHAGVGILTDCIRAAPEQAAELVKELDTSEVLIQLQNPRLPTPSCVGAPATRSNAQSPAPARPRNARRSASTRRRNAQSPARQMANSDPDPNPAAAGNGTEVVPRLQFTDEQSRAVHNVLVNQGGVFNMNVTIVNGSQGIPTTESRQRVLMQYAQNLRRFVWQNKKHTVQTIPLEAAHS